MNTTTPDPLPVLIIGAGICGLLLAQQLHQAHIPCLVFERDSTFHTRGAGWGLTLHWSLPALREILPDDLLARLPDTYVDRAAVERGQSSTFPFFDLSTGKLQGESPRAPENERIRVTREQLRRLLSEGVEVHWKKDFKEYREDPAGVTAIFRDGTEFIGRLIIGCDGSHSNVRRSLLHAQSVNHRIPVHMLGFTMSLTEDQVKPIHNLDPFFLQGTASESNVFMYISLLKAPQCPSDHHGRYVYQVCISRNISHEAPPLSTNQERLDIIRGWSQKWAEPFRSFISLVTDSTEVKLLELDDFAPYIGIHPYGKVLLVGDALHAMSMYRGEGANHVIVDVLDFRNIVLQQLQNKNEVEIEQYLVRFTNQVIERARPAVLASRQACLDAHDWSAISSTSPLLTKRQMFIEFHG